MALSDVIILSPPREALDPATEKPTVDRFDRMFGRMKGTMTIEGNIVDRDPEPWNCERDG